MKSEVPTMKNPTSCGPVLSLFLSVLLFCTRDSALALNPVIYNVGVVLDFDSWLGKTGMSCINMALSNFYASRPSCTTRIHLHPRDSPDEDDVFTAASVIDLIENAEVQAIIGPTSSMQANFVIKLGDKANVPIISYSATSPSLTTSLRSPYFFRAAQNDSSQVKAIGDIVQAFKWRQVVPIFVDNEFGQGIVPYLSDALQEVDVRIPYRSAISPFATDDQIEAELYKLMTMQTRVFIVHMEPPLAARICEKARIIGMMDEGYVWIMTSAISNLFDSFSSSFLMENLQGVLGLKTHVPDEKMLEGFRCSRKGKSQQDHPNGRDVNLHVFALWAYDAAKALAMAVEKVGTGKNLTFLKMNSSSGSNFLKGFGVSQIGPQLVQALLETSFTGISGHFSLLNGQLQTSTFQIVNVIGNGEKVVGFWTPQDGLVRKLDPAKGRSNSNSSSASLGAVIWPGDTFSSPKGWQIPTSGKKLKILVPFKEGFREFVNVTHDRSTNTTKVIGGYCLEVFEAAVQALPYYLPYEFYPYGSNAAGSYDELIDQVFIGNFDAAVGDISIRANRSSYVDFTMPYTESGVYMVVPIRDSKRKNAWVFVQPLSLELWVTSTLFFMIIALVVLALEYRVNGDFQGPRPISTSFWFSFSIMVFSQRERVVSNAARSIVIIWCIVVLILTQSYTASLTSLLTVQHLQPTVTDVNLLLKNGHNIGYQTGSFVYGILRHLGFPHDKLKTYNSTEQLHELFRNGSSNHGISAAFDEIPYIKLFLATYCSRYTMLDPSFKADGFAFAFPKDSPLASDVSSAILNVNEGGEVKKIEDRWFTRQSSCPDLNPTVSSFNLGLESFWGLFALAGGASSIAILAFVAKLFYKNRKILLESNQQSSLWTRIKHIFTPSEYYPSTRDSARDIDVLRQFLGLLEEKDRFTRAFDKISEHAQSPSPSTVHG